MKGISLSADAIEEVASNVAAASICIVFILKPSKFCYTAI
jgi:hypothetical protein